MKIVLYRYVTVRFGRSRFSSGTYIWQLKQAAKILQIKFAGKLVSCRDTKFCCKTSVWNKPAPSEEQRVLKYELVCVLECCQWILMQYEVKQIVFVFTLLWMQSRIGTGWSIWMNWLIVCEICYLVKCNKLFQILSNFVLVFQVIVLHVM